MVQNQATAALLGPLGISNCARAHLAILWRLCHVPSFRHCTSCTSAYYQDPRSYETRVHEQSWTSVSREVLWYCWRFYFQDTSNDLEMVPVIEHDRMRVDRVLAA